MSVQKANKKIHKHENEGHYMYDFKCPEIFAIETSQKTTFVFAVRGRIVLVVSVKVSLVT